MGEVVVMEGMEVEGMVGDDNFVLFADTCRPLCGVLCVMCSTPPATNAYSQCNRHDIV